MPPLKPLTERSVILHFSHEIEISCTEASVAIRDVPDSQQTVFC